MAQKEKFALYLLPEKKAELEKRYQEDGSRSLTEFIGHAIDFYLGYLSADNAGMFLSQAVKAAVGGRLGMFENRVSAMLYKLAVELDMCMNIVAGGFQLDEEYLRRQRGISAGNVKRTNGQLRFEQIARQVGEDDDEWLD